MARPLPATISHLQQVSWRLLAAWPLTTSISILHQVSWKLMARPPPATISIYLTSGELEADGADSNRHHQYHTPGELEAKGLASNCHHQYLPYTR